MNEVTNPHKELAQLRKAIALADQLTQAYAHVESDLPLSEIAELATGELWHATATMAGVHPPSEVTKAKVVDILRQREAHADDDPFDGLDESRDTRTLVERVRQDPRPRGARR